MRPPSSSIKTVIVDGPSWFKGPTVFNTVPYTSSLATGTFRENATQIVTKMKNTAQGMIARLKSSQKTILSRFFPGTAFNLLWMRRNCDNCDHIFAGAIVPEDAVGFRAPLIDHQPHWRKRSRSSYHNYSVRYFLKLPRETTLPAFASAMPRSIDAEISGFS
jgi:hypothetical protein